MRTPDEIKKGMNCCNVSATHGYCQHCPYEPEEECEFELKRDALLYIQQLEAQVPRWINAEERQPDENDIGMLVVVSGKPRDNIIFDDAIMIGFYYDGEGWVIEGWEEWENPTVTHWMPLPEPPKEV